MDCGGVDVDVCSFCCCSQVMESFRGFDHKYKYKIGGHSGDSEKLEFVKEGTCVGSLWVVGLGITVGTGPTMNMHARVVWTVVVETC